MLEIDDATNNALGFRPGPYLSLSQLLRVTITRKMLMCLMGALAIQKMLH